MQSSIKEATTHIVRINNTCTGAITAHGPPSNCSSAVCSSTLKTKPRRKICVNKPMSTIIPSNQCSSVYAHDVHSGTAEDGMTCTLRYLGSICGRWMQTLLHWRVSPRPCPAPLCLLPTWWPLMGATRQSNGHAGGNDSSVEANLPALTLTVGRCSPWHWTQGSWVAPARHRH